MGNMWQSDGYLTEVYVFSKPMEVLYDALVVYRGIAMVDVWVHILYIDKIMVDIGCYSLQVTAFDIQRRLDINTPFFWSQFAKANDLVAPQQWLTSSKCDASIRGLEIKVIHHHLVQDVQSIHPSPHAISPQALGIQAVLAT